MLLLLRYCCFCGGVVEAGMEAKVASIDGQTIFFYDLLFFSSLFLVGWTRDDSSSPEEIR